MCSDLQLFDKLLFWKQTVKSAAMQNESQLSLHFINSIVRQTKLA